MSKYRVLTIDDVESAMMELLEAEGSTTTLDVKLYLRNKGFFTIQSEVSAYMSQIADTQDIEWEEENGHRRYLAQDSPEESHEVWDKDDESSKLTITANSRHAARWKYSKMFGVKYRDTRSKKLT